MLEAGANHFLRLPADAGRLAQLVREAAAAPGSNAGGQPQLQQLPEPNSQGPLVDPFFNLFTGTPVDGVPFVKVRSSDKFDVEPGHSQLASGAGTFPFTLRTRGVSTHTDKASRSRHA